MFFGTALLCALRARASEEERSAWWLLALAMTLWGSGASYFGIFLWDASEPVPSPADIFWVAFYLPAYAALWKLLRHRAGSLSKGVWLDALVGALGVGGAAAALVFQPVLDHTSGSAGAVKTSLAYPLGDLGLLAIVIAALTVTGWRHTGIWRFIASAFALFAITDSTFLVQIADGTYEIGTVLDLGWPAAALMVGVAAWRGDVHPRRDAQRETTVIGPALFGAAALVLLVVDHFVPTTPLALALSAGSLIAVLIRLNMTVRDNMSWLAHSRREATTDSLTGLGNRRQMKADLAARLGALDPERPVMLALFDLDGFKLYNDTFGHLAGDELLARLGARLSELVAGHGTAYRMGGDEFCGVWSLTAREDATRLAERAAAALSADGKGFSVGCSFGYVLVPDETTDVTDALRMADQRMYARKGAGRASAARQSSEVLLRAQSERDGELHAPLEGLAELACATAIRLGVPEEDLEATRHTALLHDIGNIAIPDQILRKQGPLDESEWAFVRRHPVIGERIIAAAPALTRVARLVRSTHERFDGGGYPDGLRGDEIPLIARVVAVCAAYDAMASHRSYRVARSSREAVEQLREAAGSAFDPNVVEAFVHALETVQADGVGRISPAQVGAAA